MNIWEEAYSKNKEGNRASVHPNPDQNSPAPSEEPSGGNTQHSIKPPAEGESFENLYYQIGKSHQPAGTPQFRQKPRSETNQTQQQPYQSSESDASPKSTKMRFNFRILSDKISRSYPSVLNKMSNQLSDIWGNILVETKQSVEALLVCGATRKEGNTFISFYLAMFLSKEYNMKILYVDTNADHAVIPKIKNLPGFYTFVSQKKELSSLIVKTEYPGLYLLPSGAEKSSQNDGSVMLSREPVEALIQYCRNNFDITIIDGQPITMSPVMIEFARVVDMTAIVCRYGYSRREVSKMAIDKLQKFGINSIGVILNDRQFPIPQKLYRLMG